MVLKLPAVEDLWIRGKILALGFLGVKHRGAVVDADSFYWVFKGGILY